MKPLARIALVWLTEAVALVLAAAVLPGVDLNSEAEAFVAVALIGVMNALVWPLLARLTLRLMVMTAGLLALVLNGALILATAALAARIRRVRSGRRGAGLADPDRSRTWRSAGCWRSMTTAPSTTR